MTAPSTFADLLATLLREGGSRPLVTMYDDATGERTELSVSTYANWVAKTANLLTDELMLDAGDTLLLDLPPHWLTTVFLGAAWSAGLAVTGEPDVEVATVVCGPASLAVHADRGVPVLACSLLPFGVRFPDPLPDGILDYGVLWPGQSDVFVPAAGPAPGDVAWRPGDRTQQDLLAAAGRTGEGPVRLLTDEQPTVQDGVPAFLAPLVSGGSLVLVRRPEDSRWDAHRETERATAQLRRPPERPGTPG